jgi:hypothetical protein
MKVTVPENIYDTVCKSKLIHEVEIGRVNGRWEISVGILGRFCTKVLRIPRSTANGEAEV